MKATVLGWVTVEQEQSRTLWSHSFESASASTHCASVEDKKRSSWTS